MKPGDTGQIVEGVHIVCPFCRGQATIGIDNHGDGAVLHDLPLCNEFGRLGPLEYATAVRKHYEGRAAS